MLRETFINAWLRIKALVMRRKLERDLNDELAFHLAMRRQKLEQAGLEADEATTAAQRRFGNPTLLRETTRSLWTFAWLDALRGDLRYAVRAMARAPVFTTVAIVTLAFGIGANTATFSIVNGVLLRAMPYERPDDLYSIREIVQAGSQRHTAAAVNGGNILEWTRNSRSFETIAALEPSDSDLVIGNESVRLHGIRASASLFSLLGIRPQIGRSFSPEEDVMGHGLEIILTWALWRDRFASNPGILGQSVSLNGFPATVIGVLPASFYFPKEEQLYGEPIAGWTFHVDHFVNLNLGPGERKSGIGSFNFAAIGRVRPGVTRQQAIAELETIESGIGKQVTNEVSLHADLVPLKTAVIGSAASRIWILMAGAALVLAIVCVNLAGLMLGRNSARSREVAIRLALGAGRWTVLRQFMAEGLTLAMAGGTIGVLAAFAGIRLLVRYAPITLPRLESVTIDSQVLFVTACVVIAAGLLFSLLPAFRLQDQNIEETLRSATPNISSSRQTAFLHDLLAGSEIALCTILLICALLLGRSLSRVLRDNAWLNEERVLAIDVGPSPKRYQKAATRIDLYRKLIHNARLLPGVANAGLASTLPLRGGMWGADVEFAEIPMAEASRPIANFRFVSPGYDDAMGLAPVAGRSLQESDWGRDVVWISESLARNYSGGNLIGKHLKWRAPETGKPLSLEVTGIFRDVRADAEKTPVLAVYIPYWIWPPWNPSLIVRTAANPAGIAASVRRMVHSTDSQVPVTRVETLRQVLEDAVASRRFLTRLGVVFAASATFLAALGLYGVVSLAAARRRREIAIRMAIGASHSGVFRMVVVKALKLTLTSVAIGLLCGFEIERAIASLLYDVHPADPAIHACACAIVIAVGLLASFLPALRAARTDPVAALKYE